MAIGDDLSIDGVRRILVVTAHPDDLDFGAGGTIALWVAAGVEMAYCIATDGDAGGFDETISRPDMARIRRAEQTAAAAALGVSDITFLGYPDGKLSVSDDLRRDISRVIRQKRPDRVLCQSPEINFERIQGSHPDHRAAGEAALIAVYPDARNPFAHPTLKLTEGLQQHTVPSTWVMGHPTPAHVIDITETFDAKMAALKCHVSQFPKIDELEGRIREWGSRVAAAHGLPDGHLAEAFLIVDTA